MASGDRFYTLELRHRPALWGDVGNLLKIEGLVVGGEGEQAILMLPNTDAMPIINSKAAVFELKTDEWTEWLQRSDIPEVLVMPERAFHRKIRYEISGHVQQKVWVADGLKCFWCKRPMGAVQLTVDHFVPLEMGGVNDTSNYLSACRKCNRNKGAMDPRSWCALIGGDYDAVVRYLSNRVV